MIETGLVSVSFRGLSPEQIVTFAREAGLSGIEWGGDIHVPAGDVKRAEAVGEMTRQAGLQVFAYGSYYNVGANAPEEFPPVLQTAKALGAPTIRVWAGTGGSREVDEVYKAKVIENTKAICDMAAKENITVCYEYHPNTLTDERSSAVETVKKIGRDNMRLYWQPNFLLPEETENELALQTVLPYLRDVHAFYWSAEAERFPLEKGKTLWRKYLGLIAADGKDHRVMLEFCRDDCTEQMKQDAAVLNELVKEL